LTVFKLWGATNDYIQIVSETHSDSMAFQAQASDILLTYVMAFLNVACELDADSMLDSQQIQIFLLFCTSLSARILGVIKLKNMLFDKGGIFDEAQLPVKVKSMLPMRLENSSELSKKLKNLLDHVSNEDESEVN
jgi:hypothetical protein